MEYKPWLMAGAPPEALTVAALKPRAEFAYPHVVTPFLNPAECDRVLALRDLTAPRKAETGDGDRKGGEYGERISTVWEIYPCADSRWLYEKLEAAMRVLNQRWGLELWGLYEGTQIYEYPGGGFLDWHRDVGNGYMSVRKLSMSIQLTDGADYDGGELQFMDYGNQASPRGRGDMTVFPSWLMHRVTPITRGQRLCCVSWVHGPPYR